jgi:hypothetical protein
MAPRRSPACWRLSRPSAEGARSLHTCPSTNSGRHCAREVRCAASVDWFDPRTPTMERHRDQQPRTFEQRNPGNHSSRKQICLRQKPHLLERQHNPTPRFGVKCRSVDASVARRIVHIWRGDELRIGRIHQPERITQRTLVQTAYGRAGNEERRPARPTQSHSVAPTLRRTARSVAGRTDPQAGRPAPSFADRIWLALLCAKVIPLRNCAGKGAWHLRCTRAGEAHGQHTPDLLSNPATCGTGPSALPPEPAECAALSA